MMTEEKVKELTKDIQRRIKSTNRWLSANKSIGNPEGEAFRQIEIYELALAALTQPASPALKLPDGLNETTAKLVISFATALAEKLHLSEVKYGWSDAWKNPGWQDKCLADFNHHIGKGDPRDVAAYCAFMWFHGWTTSRLNAPHTAPIEPICATGGAEWSGNSLANDALIMLDRIDTRDSVDDDRIEEVKRIVRLLAAMPED
ncbi:hypothetical protein [uncultured Pantoea sp.]|uniref:hypothetical protein n=1 Tax=uncultured Pantoea sp. TaxID=218084 RepID=UPI0025E6015E|nr:hypothetical protein [uncultured Pantoea sp.]